jgi:hypothetical protein
MSFIEESFLRQNAKIVRMSSRHLRPLLLSLFLLPFACAAVKAQDPSSANDGPLQPPTDVSRPHLIDDDAILRMAKAGLSDDVIIQTIKTQPGHYDVTPDDLISLKAAGLSDKVILTMQAYGNARTASIGSGLHSRSISSAGIASTGESSPNPAPLASGVDEIGVYYKDKATGTWTELRTERVVFKSSGAVKNILSDGLLKKDMNGHLDGEKSTLVLPTGVELLIYAPAGTDANEYDFLRFELHKDSREFRTLTAGIFNSKTGSQRDEIEFHPTKIAPQMYTFTVPIDIEKGEYGVLPPGSANTQGIAGTGKIFTFSIVE